jgi:hypothetical protein
MREDANVERIIEDLGKSGRSCSAKEGLFRIGNSGEDYDAKAVAEPPPS